VAPNIVGDYVLFVRQGTAFAQRFRQSRLQLDGDPVAIADGVIADRGYAAAALSATGTNTVTYRMGREGERQLVWFDRSGNELERLGNPEPVSVSDRDLELSHDGQRLALARINNGNRDIWVLDLIRGVTNRITSDPAMNAQPVWSPDDSRIAFVSTRAGVTDLYMRSVFAGAPDQLLLATPFLKMACDWSRDAQSLLYWTAAANSGDSGLWVLPMSGGRKPFRVLQTNFRERLGQFSPDGKWVAFESTQSGRSEIYVAPLMQPGGPTRVSTNGGAQVRWRRDGKELFYLALDGHLMAASIKFAPGGPSIEPGSPVPLFTTRLAADVVQVGGDKHHYVVSPDGQRFLIDTMVTPPVTTPITLVLNWKPQR
jgi:hypothetical protein